MTGTPNDPLLDEQWQFGNSETPGFDLNIRPAWEDYTGKDILIAINDMGLDFTHPDLAANIDTALSYDDVSGQWGVNTVDAPHGDLVKFPLDVYIKSGSSTLDSPHGIMVGGCAAEVANNGIGGAGAAYNATLAGFFPDLSSMAAEAQSFANGMEWAYEIGADIVNDSWGPIHLDWPKPSLEEWQDYMSAGRDGLGGIVVMAGGNERSQSLWADYSIQHDNAAAITIGAVSQDGKHSGFSTPGPNLLATAPGDEIWTTTKDGGYEAVSGTSFAAPLTSGVTALVLEANPDLGTGDVIDILAYSARRTETMESWVDTEKAAQAVRKVLDIYPKDTAEWFPEIQLLPDQGLNSLTNRLASDWDWSFNQAGDWNGGGLHFNPDYGFGLVDARAAVRLAESWQGDPVTYDGLTKVRINDSEEASEGASLLGPEDSVTVTRTFTVEDSFQVQNAQLHATIPDAHPDGLSITLTAPSGTTTRLFDDYSTFLDYWRNGEKVVQGMTDSINAGKTFVSSDQIDLGSRQMLGESAQGEWTVEVTYHDLITTPGEARITELDLELVGKADDGDDRYIYSDAYGDLADDAARATLTDTDGGTDQFNAAMLTGDATIDLTPGAQSTLAGQTLTIASGTVIENAWTGDGNDRITGNDVANDLHGARGDDTLAGGADDDTLAGGDGADVFEFGANTGTDTVADYADGTDRIRILADSGTTAFADLTVDQSGVDAVLTLADGGRIILAGIEATSLAADDFLFA